MSNAQPEIAISAHQSTSTKRTAPQLVAKDESHPAGLRATENLFWRIVFTQSGFTLQIANNFGGPYLVWSTVSNGKKEETFRIPEGYLSALQALGHPDGFISREVVERRSVPLMFASYSEARKHALTAMGLPVIQEWHADARPARAPGMYFSHWRRPAWIFLSVAAVVLAVMAIAAPRP